jgi:hypothetical protein
MEVSDEWPPRDIFALDIMIRGDTHVLLQGKLTDPVMFWVQKVVAREVVGRYHPFDRITQESDIGRWLRQPVMDSERHVPFKHPHPPQSSSRPSV